MSNKIPEETIKWIRERLLEDKMPMKRIAEQAKVSRTTVQRMRNEMIRQEEHPEQVKKGQKERTFRTPYNHKKYCPSHY